jgi:hypothetical protein
LRVKGFKYCGTALLGYKLVHPRIHSESVISDVMVQENKPVMVDYTNGDFNISKKIKKITYNDKLKNI